MKRNPIKFILDEIRDEPLAIKLVLWTCFLGGFAGMTYLLGLGH